MDMERFEANGGMVFLFALTGLPLLALVAWIVIQAYPQSGDFGLAAAVIALFWLGGLIAAGVFLLYLAREAGASFTVDDEGITCRTWGRTTSLAWSDVERLEEARLSRPKGKTGAWGRCVLHGRGGHHLSIASLFLADGPRFLDRLEPHLVRLRESESRRLARQGGRFRPTRAAGYGFLTCMAPIFLLGGWAAFDPGTARVGQPDDGMAYLGLFALAATPLIAMLGLELVSRELTVSPDGLALRSLFLRRWIPFDRVESVTVKVMKGEGPDIERATIRGDGQKIAIESTMSGYNAILDLLHSRSVARLHLSPTNDPDFS
jgi:hypothetical protein